MGFFGGGKQKELSEDLAEQIMAQEDRLKILFEIFDKLPTDLVDWAVNTVKLAGKSKGYSEVDLATTISSTMWLPGDLLIRKNRDPKVGDMVEIAQRIDEGYNIVTVKILKINVKDGTAYVHDVLSADSKGLVAVSSIISVIDQVIKYNSPEWKKLVQILDIQYDNDDIASWIKRDIEYLKKSENFHEKELNMKKLESRLKETRQK